MALTPPHDRPWAELTADQKVDRLRHELQSFIDFYNNMTLQRNSTRDAIVKRLDSIDATLRHIDARLTALEHPNLSGLS